MDHVRFTTGSQLTMMGGGGEFISSANHLGAGFRIVDGYFATDGFNRSSG
jgi:hypothetical protein